MRVICQSREKRPSLIIRRNYHHRCNAPAMRSPRMLRRTAARRAIAMISIWHST